MISIIQNESSGLKKSWKSVEKNDRSGMPGTDESIDGSLVSQSEVRSLYVHMIDSIDFVTTAEFVVYGCSDRERPISYTLPNYFVVNYLYPVPGPCGRYQQGEELE